MWKLTKSPWDLRINRDFQPKITILVPTYNEESTIELKLENIKDVSYPKEKIEVIVADDGSKDRTIEKVKCFMEKNPELKLKIVQQNLHVGKSVTLNKALDFCKSEIIVVSDTDTLWPSNILCEALPYLSDPTVGAITGRGINRNAFQSWVTKGEESYLRLAYLIRLGESKIHSTIRFEGGFCAYKRSAFKKFDCETGSDDSGTALEVVQNGFRAILVPEAIFYTNFPPTLHEKLKIKIRRANQLIGLWIKCLKLTLKSKLRLPKRIAIPELILFIVDPIILSALAVTTLIIIVLSPFSTFSIAVLLTICCVVAFAAKIFAEVLLNNFVLFVALLSYLLGRRYVTWEKPVEKSRHLS